MMRTQIGAVPMSQRINISVPDELYQKIQHFKERLNMSRICRGAIIHAIHIEEMRDQVDEDIEKLATVFREERKESNRGFFKEGFKDGMKDALRMDYERMSSVAFAQEDSEEVFEAGASEDSLEKRENAAFETATGIIVGYAEDDARYFYVEGWADGFSDVWRRVCEKLAIHGYKKK
jgi:hypothetical protein